jgi:hypothetical protein
MYFSGICNGCPATFSELMILFEWSPASENTGKNFWLSLVLFSTALLDANPWAEVADNPAEKQIY